MIAATAHLFSDEILAKALAHFGVTTTGLRTLEGFCSHVYGGQIGEDAVILKLSHSSRISREALASELAFVAHLHRSGVPVCAPLTAPGELLEVPDGDSGCFYAYLYQGIEGVAFDESKRSSPEFQDAGRALSRLHRAARDFDHEAHPARLSYIDRDFLDFERILPADEEDTKKCFRSIIKELRDIPIAEDVYGMTHGDAHDGNLMLSEGRAVLIDFDDVEPGFFLNDVAVFVDSVCDRPGLEDAAWVELVFTNFLKGYSENLQVPCEWWAYLPVFMKFRWIMNHCVFQMLRGHLLENDPKLRAKRDRRIEMYRSGFARYEYLYEFDFVAAASRVG